MFGGPSPGARADAVPCVPKNTELSTRPPPQSQGILTEATVFSDFVIT
jgi:hypothetical protein